MSDSESSDGDPNIPSTSKPKRKKLSYKQKYKDDWEKEFKWISKNKKGPEFAWCKSCNCDVTITHGKGDLVRHNDTKKHKTSSKAIIGQGTVSAMFANQRNAVDINIKRKEADIKMAGFIAEHNLPFKLMEHLPALINYVCPDSEIGKNLSCGRTKMKSIITNVTGETEKKRITNLMKVNKFSIVVDESTDRSCTKMMCIVTRINAGKKIKDYFLALIPIQEATARALFDHLVTFFNQYQIPYQTNCIGFASDGANAMMGEHNSIVSRLKEVVPKIFIMKCICHSFHLCASYACEKLPQEVEKVTRDIYNYFSNSPKRVGELKLFQDFANVSPLKILHPSATRWLSLEAVVKRLLQQYDALTLFFTDQAYNNIIGASSILERLQNPRTRLFLEFLSYALPLFNRINLLMQSEKPQIHCIYRKVTNIIKVILECYIKDDIIQKDMIYDIDFKNPRNFMPIEDMYFGAVISKSSAEANVLRDVKIKCLDFYIESVHQILSRFPLKNSILSKLQFIDPAVVRGRKILTIADLDLYFPHLITDIQQIDTEWRILRNLDFNDLNLNEDDVIKFWTILSKITLGSGEKQFPLLTDLVFNLLCLPHSSANVERIFSQVNLNKTQLRNRFKPTTLEGLLLTKSLVANTGNCYNFKVTSELTNKINSSTLYTNKKQEFDSDSSE